MSNWLVCRPILANSNAVMSEDVDHPQAHNRAQAYRRFHVVGKYEKRCTEGDYSAMGRHAIYRCAHCMLTHPEGNIAARITPRPTDGSSGGCLFRWLEISLLL